MTHRLIQVNENLQRELSRLLVEMIDWEGVLATVTHVHVEADLRQATVWLSVLNSDTPQIWIDLLNKRSSDIYTALSKRLKMKFTPALKFMLDEHVEEIYKLDSLIDQIHR